MGAGSRVAMATSCAIPRILAPKMGQTDVPLDTRLWFGYQFSDDPVTLKLVGPGGEVPVETRKVELPGSPFVAFVATPRQELAPSTSYVFEATCAEQSCSGGANQFTTGTARAPRPPLPVVRKQEPFAPGGPAGDDRAVVFDFDPQDLLVVVDVAGASPFRAEQPESALTGGWGVERVWVGEKACNMPEARFPLDSRGHSAETANVRFGRIDLAGNFSGWTDARSVTLPPPAGGCSVSGHGGGGPSSSLVALVLFALVARLRRRRLSPG